MQTQPNPLIYLVIVLVMVPLLYFRLRRTMRPEALKLSQLWFLRAKRIMGGQS